MFVVPQLAPGSVCSSAGFLVHLLLLFLLLLLLLFLLLRWRYSSWWALASFKIRLQASRSHCSVSPFVYFHLSQVDGHVIQPFHFWSSSSTCCIELSVQSLLWNCCVLHSFYVTKGSYSLAFNEPDIILRLMY